MVGAVHERRALAECCPASIVGVVAAIMLSLPISLSFRSVFLDVTFVHHSLVIVACACVCLCPCTYHCVCRLRTYSKDECLLSSAGNMLVHRSCEYAMVADP